MRCENCGAENANGAKFCKECGKTLETGSHQEVVPPPQKAAASQFVDSLKMIPKKTLAGVCAAVLILAVIIGMAVSSGNTINLNKYITIEAEGYDGYGTAQVGIDLDALEEKYGDKLKFTSSAQKEYGEWLSLATPLEVVLDCVNIELDTDTGLKNGDTIHYTWTVNEELSKYVKCKVKCKDGDYEVSGLTEVASFDAFANLSVSFEGISPNGTISIAYNGPEMSSNDVILSAPNGGYRNGDSVTLTIAEDSIENMARNYGKVPAETQKTYTVSGLDENVESFAGLTDEFIASVKAETEDVIYSYIAQSYNESSKVEDLTYAGYIMNHTDSGSSYGAYNNLYIIYSGRLSSEDNSFAATDVYYPVQFSNILQSQNTVAYESRSDVIGSSSLGGWWFSTRGYTDPLTCYLEITGMYDGSYAWEAGDGFEKYEDYTAVSSLSDLDDSFRASIQDEARATIEAYMAEEYIRGWTATDLAYVGEYLLNAKEETDIQDQNIYVVVFKATLSNDESSFGKFDATDVYYPVQYNGLVKLGNNECMAMNNSGIQGSHLFRGYYFSTDGYVDGAEMYSEIVTSRRDSYEYEVSEGLQQFGN